MDKKQALDKIIFLLEELEEAGQRLKWAGGTALDMEIALLNQQILSLYKHIQDYQRAEAVPPSLYRHEPPVHVENKLHRFPTEPKPAPVKPAEAVKEEPKPEHEKRAEYRQPELTRQAEPKPEEKPAEQPRVSHMEAPAQAAEKMAEERKPEPALKIEETPKPEPAKMESGHLTESPKQESPASDIASIYAQARERAAQAAEAKKNEKSPNEQIHEQVRLPQQEPLPGQNQPPQKEPLYEEAQPRQQEPLQEHLQPSLNDRIQEQAPPSLSDQLQEHAQPSLNEKLAPQHVRKNLADKLKLTPISDLRTAISLNQRVAFIKQLFNGDEKEFKKTIAFVNGCRNFSEAKMYLQSEVASHQKWQEENPLVDDFMELVYRKFL